MKKNSVKIITFFVVCIVFASIFSANAAETEKKVKSGSATLISMPDPVALVNGVAVSAKELQKVFYAFSKSPAASGIPNGKEKEVHLFLLNQMISNELMFQIAKSTVVSEAEKQVDSAVSKLRVRFKTDDEYNNGLKEQGLSEKELREMILRHLTIETYIEKNIVSKNVVTDAEVKAFYDRNLAKFFTRPEQIKASHILVTVDPKATDAEKKKALSKAEELLKQIRNGADFEKLAIENSGCPSGKQGGSLGYFGKGKMTGKFESAAFGLNIGDVSNVVATEFGYHIIKLFDKRASAIIPFNDVKTKIHESISREKTEVTLKKLLEDKRNQSKIEIFLK